MSWDDQKISWDECLKYVFGVFLVLIFLHSDWILRDTYSVRMRENTDQKISEYGQLSCSGFCTYFFFFFFFCLFDMKHIFWWYRSAYIYSYFSSQYIFHYFLSSTASVFLVVSFSSFIFSWTQAFLTVLLQWLSRKQFF